MSTPSRHVFKIFVPRACRLPDGRVFLVLSICGSSFLYHMIRKVVGALVGLMRGALTEAWLSSVLLPPPKGQGGRHKPKAAAEQAADQEVAEQEAERGAAERQAAGAVDEGADEAGEGGEAAKDAEGGAAARREEGRKGLEGTLVRREAGRLDAGVLEAGVLDAGRLEAVPLAPAEGLYLAECLYFAYDMRRSGSRSTVKVLPLAVPQLGCCTSSGCGWWLRAARHPQGGP